MKSKKLRSSLKYLSVRQLSADSETIAGHYWKPLFDSLGANYKIDLMNEGIPNYQPGNTNWKNAQLGWLYYSQRLWNDYRSTFGISQTFGFSFTPGAGGYSEYNLFDVYGTIFPPVFDLHFYDQAYSTYVNTWNLLRGRGETQGWVIGETYYNDQESAIELTAARSASGNVVFWLAQWPIVRGSSCTPAPPLDFSQYIAYGW